MMFATCMVCNDKNKYRVAVYDAERIYGQLARLVGSEEEVKDTSLWNRIRADHKHVHFMCGTCREVDDSALKTVELRLHKVVYSACEKLRRKENLPIHDILRLLQGYYPILYRCVDECRRKVE